MESFYEFLWITKHKMDERQLDYILYNLTEQVISLKNGLVEVEELLEDEANTDEQKIKLLEEKEDIEYDIRECEIDIAMYTEVMNKLYPRTVGLCGYSCDGQCQQCRSGYDAHDEVFTGRDY